MISDRASPRFATWLNSSTEFDQLHAGVVAALEREGEERPGAVRVEPLRPLVPGRRRQARIGHVLDPRVASRARSATDHGVLHVLLHPQPQRLGAEQRLGALCGAMVMPRSRSPMAMRMEGVGHRPEGLVELQPVVGRLRLGQARELARGRPVELAGVDHAPARHGAVAGQVLGGRVHDECRAHLDRAAELGRGRGVVDDQRHPEPLRHLGERRDVGDIAAGIGDRSRRRSRASGRRWPPPAPQVLGVDELGRPAEAPDGVGELGDRAAVEPGRGDDVVARPHQREQRHDLRRVPRGGADRRPRRPRAPPAARPAPITVGLVRRE